MVDWVQLLLTPVWGICGLAKLTKITSQRLQQRLRQQGIEWVYISSKGLRASALQKPLNGVTIKRRSPSGKSHGVPQTPSQWGPSWGLARGRGTGALRRAENIARDCSHWSSRVVLRASPFLARRHCKRCSCLLKGPSASPRPSH